MSRRGDHAGGRAGAQQPTRRRTLPHRSLNQYGKRMIAMSSRNLLGLAALAALLFGAPMVRAADEAAERQSLDETRNTVINLVQALVDKGLLTREQAEQLIKRAQDKAAADAAATAAKNAAQAKEDENAVRVPYVPQIVKDEISKQVTQEVKPAVVADVVQEAK
jgi:polyhydroxyalkanoate synthesis regulator phasin